MQIHFFNNENLKEMEDFQDMQIVGTCDDDAAVFFHNGRVVSGDTIAEVRITRARSLAFSRVSIIALFPAREYRCPTFR